MISKIGAFLRDAVLDYSPLMGKCRPEDWLQDYLCRKLPGKSVEAIHAISSEILETLDLMEKKKAAMNAAKAAGQSAEQWLVSDIMQEEGGNGEKARKAAEFLNGIMQADAELSEATEVEVIDTEDLTAYQDDDWNDYKLKDSVKAMAKEAGQCGLREIAANVFVKAAEEGVAAVVKDKEFLADALIDGAGVGLKVALSAGLAVAEDVGIIPPASFKVLAAVAHKTVESLSVFKAVVKGKCTVTDALIHIKDTAVSTFSGLWSMHKDEIRAEIVDAVGMVFGYQGALVAGAVNGLFITNREESKIVTVLKEAGKAAVRLFTKEVKLPFFRKKKALEYNPN